MKKKIVVITVVILAMLAISAAAIAAFNGWFAVEQTDMLQERAKQRTEDTRQLLKEALSAITRQGELEDSDKLALEKYLSMVALYQPSAADQKAILSLAAQGCTLSKLVDIYIFLLDAQEGAGLLSDVYDTSVQCQITGRNWIENAYNLATGEKHGVLDHDQIAHYLERGLSVEDIRVANIASRKGVMTIAEILDQCAKGKSWAELLSKIYQIPQAKTLQTAEGENGMLLLQSIRDAYVTGKSVNEIYEVNISGGDTVARYVSEKKQQVVTYLKQEGLYYEVTEETVRQAQKTVTNVEPETVEVLLRDQYTITEIEKAAKIAEKAGESVEEILTQYREENMSLEDEAATEEDAQ